MKNTHLLMLVALLLTACNALTKEQQANVQAPTHRIKACTKIYMPVCAKVTIQCVTTPCEPVEQTFSNLCMIENNKNATLLHNGKCKK